MLPRMTVFEGGCHCGNLAYVFTASASLETLGLRADMCGFCRAHGARNTSDPKGSMRIAVYDATLLERYRFALKTADFLICRRCGVYIGALLDDKWFTVNANTFRDPPPLDVPLVPHDFDAEDVPTRIARRKARWTPVASFKIGAVERGYAVVLAEDGHTTADSAVLTGAQIVVHQNETLGGSYARVLPADDIGFAD
jgi:hypothetical protein